MANVTVLPLQRINTPPKAMIVPARQIVTLPTDKVAMIVSARDRQIVTLPIDKVAMIVQYQKDNDSSNRQGSNDGSY